jgi:hypothetical protein
LKPGLQTGTLVTVLADPYPMEWWFFKKTVHKVIKPFKEKAILRIKLQWRLAVNLVN